MTRVYDFVFRFQRYILGLAVFLSLLAVSINIDFATYSVDLVWKDRPVMALLMIATGLLLFLLYIQIDNYKLRQLRVEIQQKGLSENNNREELLDELTNRQRQIYDLILAGKTNKEITSELYIEPSTLKTHINQLYKKLHIKSRKELKNLHKKAE